MFLQIELGHMLGFNSGELKENRRWPFILIDFQNIAFLETLPFKHFWLASDVTLGNYI